MKALARLMLIYFVGTPLRRWVAAAGLAMSVAGVAGMLSGSSALFANAPSMSPLQLAVDALLVLMPTAGVILFFLGGSLMPIVVARFATSRQLYVLPHGRLVVATSAVCTVLAVSLLFTLIVYALYRPYPLEHLLVIKRALLASSLCFSLVYVVLWFVSRARSALGLLGGAMLVIGSISLPFGFILQPSQSLLGPSVVGGLVLAAVIALFLLAPRLKAARVLRTRTGGSVRNSAARYRSGREHELLLGTARPWLLAVGQVFPLLVATWFIFAPEIWLFYFALFSVISGAVASLATARSRSLWLCSGWSRLELFDRVESAFLKHNSRATGVLLLFFVAIGSYLDFEVRLLALGLPLLVLGTLTSTYLGLMMTRGIGWWDSLLAVGTMLLLMAASVQAADPKVPASQVIAIEALLAVMAVAFKLLARDRWSRLDWMLCRPERGAAGGSAG